MTVFMIPSSLNFFFFLVTSTDIWTGVPFGKSLTALVTRNPIAAALVFERSVESFARPNLSKVVQYSKCKIEAFLLYTTAPSQGDPISSTSSSSKLKVSLSIDSKSNPLDLTVYLWRTFGSFLTWTPICLGLQQKPTSWWKGMKKLEANFWWELKLLISNLEKCKGTAEDEGITRDIFQVSVMMGRPKSSNFD